VIAAGCPRTAPAGFGARRSARSRSSSRLPESRASAASEIEAMAAKRQIVEERWPNYASQRPQNVDAMLAELGRNERAKSLTAPSRRRNVWAAAAGAGALALIGVVAYFQPPTSLSDASEHEVATGVLSDGSTVQAEMIHRKIRGPQKASGDRKRPSTAEHDQPEIALGSEALQSPPAEQPKREAGLLLPRNRNRRGRSRERRTHLWSMAGRSSMEKTVHLSGVEMIAPDKADQVDHWIKAHGRYLKFNPAGASTYRCLTTQKLDVAQVLLLNGVARATPDAEPLYREAEEQALAARRGLWH
jgi:hypothetical protein